MGQASFRKAVRVLALIQFDCFTLDSRFVGPLVWGFSAGVAAKGGDSLLSVSNAIGTTVHPNVMNKFKDAKMKEKMGALPSERVDSTSFCAFCT